MLKIDPLLIDEVGHVECLLGNDAIVRGALEAGVAFAAGYPGTPSSEITDSFARLSKAAGVVFEYSVNEKIALEMAFAASLAGARAICAMKHLGLMYAGDPLSTIPYVGPVAGLVVVAAGDPSCRTSPNEQDQRYLAPMLHIPILDPATPAEAYEMARFAFELSEKSELPVILRPTTRVCHSRANIRYGRLTKPRVSGFVRDAKRFVPIPNNARPLRLTLTNRIEKARQLISESDFIHVQGQREFAILTCGAPAATTTDVITERGLSERVRLIRIGGLYPLPEEKIIKALEGVTRVLVIEELSPFLEDCLRALCNRRGLTLSILGKHSGHLPVEFELEPDQIEKAICEAFDIQRSPDSALPFEPVPPRPPTLCPGCPHRASQYVARTVFGPDALYFNDIGCYTLGYGPPLNTADALLCMGAGFSLAAGVSRVTNERTVGFMGDSTFFHSGMPALLNAIKEKVNMVAVILDNQVTAMTGFQESPGVSMADKQLNRTVSIPDLVQALGVEHVEQVDPYDLPEAIAAFERAKHAQGVSVVICKRACPGFLSRTTQMPYKVGTYTINHTRCQTCGREVHDYRCKDCTAEGFERHMALCRSKEITEQPHQTHLTQVAPCSAHCPLGLCIQGFIGNIAAERYQAAFEQIMLHLCLPHSVCRVCHKPCEEVCLRGDLDQAIAINDLKRFVLDWAARQGLTYAPEQKPKRKERVAVVGSGPAGLAAAYDLHLRGYQVTVFERSPQPGGLLLDGIPGYRLPHSALKRDLDWLSSLGVQFECNRELGKEFLLSQLVTEFEAVFLAIGAHQSYSIRLDTQGKKHPEIVDALSFLEQVNRGQAQAVGSQVVVVGGGNAALDAARACRRLGAKSVQVIYRRTQDDMPAIKEEIEAARQEGVHIRCQLQPIAVDETGVLCVSTQPGAPDTSGRARPVPVEGSQEHFQAELILSAIGQGIDTQLVCDASLGLQADHQTTLRTNDHSCQTAHPTVFAGGDLTSTARTVTQSMAAGRLAAWEIDRLLAGADQAGTQPWTPEQPNLNQVAERPAIQRVDRADRQKPPLVDDQHRLQSFGEVSQGFSEQQALAEASRCLICGQCGNCRACLDLFGCPAFYVDQGQIQIDPELCMGCGVCARLCPNGAIEPVQNDQPQSQADKTPQTPNMESSHGRCH